MFMYVRNASFFVRNWRYLIPLSLLSCLWILWACLEKIFKQLQFLRFPVTGGHCCSEGFGQFLNAVNVVVETCRIAVAYQLCEDQESLVCFDHRRAILLSNCGWLLERVFSLKNSQGSKRESLPKILSLCEKSSLGLSQLCGKTDRQRTPHHDEDRCENNPSFFPFFHVSVPGCSRNDSRLCPYLWIQKKFV